MVGVEVVERRGVRTQVKVVHAVGHQHVVEQGEPRVVVPGEERVVSVGSVYVPLCRNRTETQLNTRVLLTSKIETSKH